MVRYGLEGVAEVKYDKWAKNYKQISLHVKREYLENGEVIESEDKEILKKVEKGGDRVLKKKQITFNYKTGESRDVMDYFLVLDNKEYIEPSVEYYSIGASNTSHKTSIRLIFKIDYVDFILEYTYTTGGSYAVSFQDMIGVDGGVASVIDEIAGSEEEFLDKGIKYKEDGESDYYIIGLDGYKQPVDFEISERELLKSLIGVEVITHETEIE